MSDISKCMGKDCAIRNTCLRFLLTNPDIPDSPWQSYVEAAYKDESCENFWEAGERWDQ